MAINNGYTPNVKTWDEMGRITPVTEFCEGNRPNLEAEVAAWLPIGSSRLEERYKAYIVVSVGKVVALDNAGALVPAGLRKAWNVASSSTILTYTATDVSNYVIDLTTGSLVTAAATYTEAQVTAALKERGLIRPDERAMDFIGKAIGFAATNYYKASGSDSYNPANLYQHNFRPQAKCTVVCDVAMHYPLLPAKAATETTDGAIGSSIDWSSARTGGWFNSTALAGLVKYSGVITAGDDIVGYVTEKYPLAANTTESTYEASVAGLVNEVDGVANVTAAGDYFIDRELGIIFFYEAGGDAIPSPWSVSTTLTYYHYEDEGTSTNTVSNYACITGNVRNGDFLTYDSNSNLVKATLDIGTAEGYNASFALYSTDPDYSAAADAAISLQIEKAVSGYVEGIIGQVIGDTIYPRDSLERVKTAYSGQSAANMRTPGSATDGRTDQLTYANGAEKMVRVNIILR